MHQRHFKKVNAWPSIVVFCLREGGGYTSSYFLSASSAKNLASFSWFSKASIRSSSDKLRFSKTLRILQPKNMPNGGITTDYTAPLRPILQPIQQWGQDVGDNNKSVLTHSHLSKGVNDLKQNGTQVMSSFSGRVFYTLSQGAIHFFGTVSFCYQHNHKIFVVGFHWTFIGCLKFLTIQKSALTR